MQARLIGEYDNLGRARMEHVWLDDRPVAAITYGYSGTSTTPNSTVVSYVETDHLGTPRLITNASRQKRWSWDSAPYGDTFANENPEGLGVYVYNLRFPGQYFDKETNHHYNHHRDYESTSGRYVQSDPIGLEGGINTYTYAEADPESSVDSNWGNSARGLRDRVAIDFVFQLYENGGNLACIDVSSLLIAGAFGAVGSFGADKLLSTGLRRGMSRPNPNFPRRTERTERSRWIPGKWGGPHADWNQTIVWGSEHAVTDPARHQFLNEAWRQANPLRNPASRGWARTPPWVKGGLGGGTAGALVESCGCP